ncbi:MAG: hypothetical protein WC821_03005 [archaeon]|jgi:hypothetical protein
MKGFFGYALGLAMLIVLLYLGISLGNHQFELEKVKNELIITEISNKEKTLLENNTDKIIRTKLEEQIILKNYNLIKAQNEINSTLSNYFKGKANAMSIFNEKLGEATTSFLNQNSSVAIFEAQGITYAEYTFTSNLLKNTTVGKKLGNKIITYFQIPIGYTTKIIRIS